MDTKQRVHNLAFLADCERIHREWHERAKARDTNGLLALYADDAVLETPLVEAIFDGRPSGTLRDIVKSAPSLWKARGVGRTISCAGIGAAGGSRTESDCLFGSIRAPRRTGIKSTSLRSWRLPMA